MKTIRNFMSVLILLIAAYSCEPEEMPESISPASTLIGETDPDTDSNVEDNEDGTEDHGDNDDETGGSHEEG
jgi:hypothetical protein